MNQQDATFYANALLRMLEQGATREEFIAALTAIPTKPAEPA